MPSQTHCRADLHNDFCFQTITLRRTREDKGKRQERQKSPRGFSHASGDCLDPVGARRSSGPCGSRGYRVSERPRTQTRSNPISAYTRPPDFSLRQPSLLSLMSYEVMQEKHGVPTGCCPILTPERLCGHGFRLNLTFPVDLAPWMGCPRAATFLMTDLIHTHLHDELTEWGTDVLLTSLQPTTLPFWKSLSRVFPPTFAPSS